MNKIFMVVGLTALLIFGFAFYTNTQTKARREAFQAQIEAKQQAEKQQAEEDRVRAQMKLQVSVPNDSKAYLKQAEEQKKADQALAEQNGKSAEAVKLISDLYQRWQDTERVAGSTSRIALAQPVQALQEIKRSVDAAVVPECAVTARASLSSAMAKIIDGYIAFMSNAAIGELVSTAMFVEAKPLFLDFEQRIKDCSR